MIAMGKKCAATGSAGSIGSELSHALLAEEWWVTGIAALAGSYDPGEKQPRASHLTRGPNFSRVRGARWRFPCQT